MTFSPLTMPSPTSTCHFYKNHLSKSSEFEPENRHTDQNSWNFRPLRTTNTSSHHESERHFEPKITKSRAAKIYWVNILSLMTQTIVKIPNGQSGVEIGDGATSQTLRNSKSRLNKDRVKKLDVAFNSFKKRM